MSWWSKLFNSEKEMSDYQDWERQRQAALQIGLDRHKQQAQQNARDLDQQLQMQMAQMQPWNSAKMSQSSPKKELDMYERTQLALQQLQILFSAGELEKHELLNATRMTLSLDRENLVVVEEIIKSKLA